VASKKEIQDKVQRILAKNYSVRLGPDEDYMLKSGSTFVNVSVKDPVFSPTTKEEDAYYVRVYAPLLDDVEASNELFEYVSTAGLGGLVGLSLSLQENPSNPGHYALILGSTILGNFLDEDELVNAVTICGYVADQNDDDLASMFGGSVINPDGNY
tara:strand:- start:545 stop:1012 length:468 start_codon:yes stop_codon:yes gene_type:complete